MSVHILGLQEEVSRLSSIAGTDSEIREDVWRLENAWFGPHYLPQSPGQGLLLCGLRSGLEAALALRASPSTNVEVVVSRGARLNLPTIQYLRELGGDRFRINYWDQWIRNSTSIHTIRIDLKEWDSELVEELLKTTRPKVLVGEIKDVVSVSAAHWLRRFVTVAGECFFRITDTPVVLTGARFSEVEVSVIVPAYGVENYIGRCLASLVAQTLDRLEIVVVDDGSKDRSGEIADDWAAQYPQRIRVIHRQNGGCAAARMTGLEAARGDYIAFVDADDWVSPQMMQRLHSVCIVNHAEIAQCGYIEAYSDGSSKVVIDCCRPESRAEADWGFLVDPAAYRSNRPTMWRRLYRRDFLEMSSAQFPTHLPRFDDLPFQFISLSKAKRMVAIPEAHYYYDCGRPGQDVAVRDKRLFVHFAIFAWIASHVAEWSNPAIERDLALAELNSHLWVLKIIDPHLSGNYQRQAAHQFLRTRQTLSWMDLLQVCRKQKLKGIKFLLMASFLFILGAPKRPIIDETIRPDHG
ncbi:glycosyltransferase [Pseudorhodoplanes sp.]|uniref:glycosyltransferase n=1 Tax=Pseudorhodoplanes sp. TaxID=1934341 RepID=UPI003D099ACB